MSRDHASGEERFRCLCTEHVDPVLGFARLADQADEADEAADIVADAFLAAWRRRMPAAGSGPGVGEP